MFSAWLFDQVVISGEMIEYYDISGCSILRPWTMSIWDTMQVRICFFGTSGCLVFMFNLHQIKYYYCSVLLTKRSRQALATLKCIYTYMFTSFEPLTNLPCPILLTKKRSFLQLTGNVCRNNNNILTEYFCFSYTSVIQFPTGHNIQSVGYFCCWH